MSKLFGRSTVGSGSLRFIRPDCSETEWRDLSKQAVTELILFKFISSFPWQNRSNSLFFMQERQFYTYIMASKSRVIYIGYTNNLWTRVLWHKSRLTSCFTQKYYVTRLVYYEQFTSPVEAILREKQLKRWRRDKKVYLIEQQNPEWEDLAENEEIFNLNLN